MLSFSGLTSLEHMRAAVDSSTMYFDLQILRNNSSDLSREGSYWKDIFKRQSVDRKVMGEVQKARVYRKVKATLHTSLLGKAEPPGERGPQATAASLLLLKTGCGGHHCCSLLLNPLSTSISISFPFRVLDRGRQKSECCQKTFCPNYQAWKMWWNSHFFFPQ